MGYRVSLEECDKPHLWTLISLEGRQHRLWIWVAVWGDMEIAIQTLCKPRAGRTVARGVGLVGDCGCLVEAARETKIMCGTLKDSLESGLRGPIVQAWAKAMQNAGWVFY